MKKLICDRALMFTRALIDAVRGAPATKRRKPVTFATYDMGFPRVSGDKVLQLAAELEDGEIVRQMGLGR